MNAGTGLSGGEFRLSTMHFGRGDKGQEPHDLGGPRKQSALTLETEHFFWGMSGNQELETADDYVAEKSRYFLSSAVDIRIHSGEEAAA